VIFAFDNGSDIYNRNILLYGKKYGKKKKKKKKKKICSERKKILFYTDRLH
jgi:hypothetical protein